MTSTPNQDKQNKNKKLNSIKIYRKKQIQSNTSQRMEKQSQGKTSYKKAEQIEWKVNKMKQSQIK
jgi:hypothetical protein